MKPYKCPICHGKGKVVSGFYPDQKGKTDDEWVTCRGCNGAGIIWGGERPTYVPYPVYPEPYWPYDPYRWYHYYTDTGTADDSRRYKVAWTS